MKLLPAKNNKNSEKFKIAFLGRGQLGMNVLQALLSEENFTISVIITCAATPEVKLKEDAFKKVAQDHKIDYYHLSPPSNSRCESILKSYDLDLGVAMLWGATISQAVIDGTRFGFINCHSGLLPRYRGNACFNWAILNNENEVGITVHFMEGGKLDSGPLISQRKIRLNKHTYIKELMDGFDTIGSEMVAEAVKSIQQNKIKGIQQNEKQAFYCYPRIPSDGEIDWGRSSFEIYALIRATSKPYPGAYTYFSDIRDKNKIKKMVIWKAHIEKHPLKEFYAMDGHLIKLNKRNNWGIVCGNKELIILDEIEIDNKKIETNKYFRTVRQRMGLDISCLIALSNKI